MPLVEAKCTSCGAVLEVENSKEAAICPYCGTAYIVEKAISYHNIHNNINANVVNIFGATTDFEIRAGELVRYSGVSPDVFIPDTVSIIGHAAFKDCKGLRHVTIPETVNHIEDEAFMNCTGLVSIAIPKSVSRIGKAAFWGCSNIRDIRIPDSVVQIGFEAFCNCTSLEKIVLPGSLTEIGGSDDETQQFIFNYCKNLREIVFLDGIKRISMSAFWYCPNIIEITIPDSVQSFKNSTSHTIIGKKRYTDLIVYGVRTINASIDTRNRLGSELSSLASTTNQILDGYEYGCYVATCIYGSYDCPQVWTLRRFRDYTLASTWHGRLFIRIYYAVSPTLVRWFGHTKWFKNYWKVRLDKMVIKLQENGFESTPYQDKAW